MKRKVPVSRIITIALGSTNYVDLNIWGSAYTYFRYAFLQSRVAQSVECLAMGWTTGRSSFDPRQRIKDFSSSLCVQTGSGAHPASCSVGTGGPFYGAKARPGHDADHSPLPSAEVEDE
jgi:hypothetical protein